MRTIITELPYLNFDKDQEWHMHGLWPVRWISAANLGTPPYVVAYRRQFKMKESAVVRAHVSADERYELYLDGKRIGRGSEFGDPNNWYYETYDIPLSAGKHTIVAIVWSLGEKAPYAQMSVEHGFIFAPQDEYLELLGTGIAPWEYMRIQGIDFTDPRPAFGTGANLLIHASRYPFGVEAGKGSKWRSVQTGHSGTNGRFRNNIFPSHLMRPATLPPMIERPITTGHVCFVSSNVPKTRSWEQQIVRKDHRPGDVAKWEGIRHGKPLTLPPGTLWRAIYDLEDYYCAYPSLTVSGGKGTQIAVVWSESLFNEMVPLTKGDRNALEGKYFSCVGDAFNVDGSDSRTFKTLWWQAGRYLSVILEVGSEPLIIESLQLEETRYPLEMESAFKCNDDRYNDVVPIAFRALQTCAHETYIDCPYYEQMMYSGDTRLAGLATMVCTHDDRLLRKSIDMFDYSRTASGLTQSRYPCRVRQIIAPFTLFWVGMVYDYSIWRNEPDTIRRHLPGVRAVLEAFLAMRNNDGLIECHEGWNFMDWVPTWTDGVHHGMEYGPSGIINLQLVYVLNLAAKLEASVNEPELQTRWKRAADEIFAAVTKAFWDDQRGLFADDVRHQWFSEHAQCFAVLSGKPSFVQLDRLRDGLQNDTDLARATISFSHYLFEACRSLDLPEVIYRRMQPWLVLKAQGFKTTPEQPEPTRSDCHGWGAHIIYHYFATTLGIRPAGEGFAQVEIQPMLGPLTSAKGTLVHPLGMIDVDIRRDEDELSGCVTLPAGLTGVFKFGDSEIELTGGQRQEIRLANDCKVS